MFISLFCWWMFCLVGVQSVLRYQLIDHRHRTKLPFPRKHVDYNLPPANRGRRNIQGNDTNSLYEPIRIRFDTRLIEERLGENEVLDAKIRRVLNLTLPAAAKKWSQHLFVIPVQSAIPVEPSDCYYEDYEHREIASFSDADLVIVVGGDKEGLCGERVLAYAGSCVLDDSMDRPIIGYIEFCLEYLANSTLSTEINGVYLKDYFGPRTGSNFREEHLRIDVDLVAIHEMAHILGMGYDLFPYFRDETGAPRTPRDSFGEPIRIRRLCDDGTIKTGFFPSVNTIRVVQLEDGRTEQYLVTPRVQAIARNHFNCSSLIGGRLQNSGGGQDTCVGSHWSERHLLGELLSPAMTDSSENILSQHTLAVMEDSGWYQVDYRGANPLAFGNGAGCEFLEEPCIDSATNQIPDWVHGEFCDQPFAVLDSKDAEPQFLGTDNIYCDPAYFGWTACDLIRLIDGTTPKMTYFSDPELAPFLFVLADGCPIPDAALGLDCRIEDPYVPFYEGEIVGETSRCVNAFYDSDGKTIRRPSCMHLECDAKTRQVRIGIGERQQMCTYNGELLPVFNMTDAYFVCPRLASVCPDIYSCPDGCFGRGECIFPERYEKPFCRCFDERANNENCAPEAFSNFTASAEPTRPLSTPNPTVDPTFTESNSSNVPSSTATIATTTISSTETTPPETQNSSTLTPSKFWGEENQSDVPYPSSLNGSPLVSTLPSPESSLTPSFESSEPSSSMSDGLDRFHFTSWIWINAVSIIAIFCHTRETMLLHRISSRMLTL